VATGSSNCETLILAKVSTWTVLLGSIVKQFNCFSNRGLGCALGSVLVANSSGFPIKRNQWLAISLLRVQALLGSFL